jgi:hypothetical protein
MGVLRDGQLTRVGGLLFAEYDAVTTLGVEFLKAAVEIAEPAPAERSRSLSALATAWESERPGEYAAPAAEAAFFSDRSMV